MAFYAEPGDVAKLAMNIEDAGEQFYRKLADMVRDEKAKSLFSYLADQEEQHKIIFGVIVQEAKNEKQSEYVIDIMSQMKTGISDLVTFVFPAENNPDINTDIFGALKIAVHAEEESIRIYSEMKRVFINRFTDVLSKVIAEEQKHRKILLDFQNTIPSIE
jgi:rubrerythrin